MPESWLKKAMKKARRIGLRVNQLQNRLPPFPIAFAADQPAWAFRQTETEQAVDQRWNRLHAQHPAPRIFPDASESCVRGEGNENAEHDVELEHTR